MSERYVHSEVFRGGPVPTVLIALGGALVLLALALPLLDHPPEYDELLHVLAARGIDAGGVPAIADGTYTRATLYTRIVAFFNEGFGGELIGARLPALLAGALLVGLCGAWVTARAGWFAGLTAAAVLAIFPIVLHSAVLVRFYTLHTLLMTAFVILVHELSFLSRWRALRIGPLLALATVPLLLIVGWMIHELTLIAVGAALAALVAVIAYDARGPLISVARTRPALFVLALLSLAALAAFVAWRIDVIGQLRGTMAPWSAGRADYVGFYLGALGFQMPFFWPLLPVLSVAALIARPRLALFCLVFVGVGLVANSIAAQKAMRYILQLLPFMAALWGIGLQSLIVASARGLAAGRASRVAPIAFALIALVGVSIANTHEFKRSLKLLLQRGIDDGTIPVLEEPDWSLANAALEPPLDAGGELIVSSGVKGLYFLDRYDFELSGSVVEETVTGEEFGTDPRTGRQVISTRESVERVIDSAGEELFVLETRKLGLAYGTNGAVLETLNERCEPVELPPASQLSAWRCT